MKMKAKLACTCEGDYQPNVLILSLGLCCKKNVCFLNNNDVFHSHHAFLSRTPGDSILSFVHLWGRREERVYFLRWPTISVWLVLVLRFGLMASQESPQSRANWDGWSTECLPMFYVRFLSSTVTQFPGLGVRRLLLFFKLIWHKWGIFVEEKLRSVCVYVCVENVCVYIHAYMHADTHTPTHCFVICFHSSCNLAWISFQDYMIFIAIIIF